MTDFSSLPRMAPDVVPKSGGAARGIPKTEVIPPSAADKRDAALRGAAEKLEASFLAEMLKSAGFGKARESFGGGAGEDQFSSFLRQAQAEEMVRSGGIGLAESLYQALKEREK